MANRGSYPHPVIDTSDDVDSNFEVLNVLVDPSQQDIEITYEIRTDDPDLIRLLESGAAMHSLRWRCSSTISADDMKPEVTHRTPTGFRLKAWLDQQLVKGNVVADARVILTKDMIGHRWVRQHAEYGGARFDLLQGDILAEAGTFSFSAEKLFDPLDPPIGSCFSFVRSTSRHKRILVTYDSDDTVNVQIPAKTFDDFKLFSHRPDLQIALVVLPALMDTLMFIKENREQEPLGDKAWFNAIEQLVEDRGGWDQNLLELAQKILESPIDTAIRTGIEIEEDD
jgi:hypothetical protein